MAAVIPARTGVSPSSSPRLPSPPPMPELQFGPQSPSIGSTANEFHVEVPDKPDESARRRIRPGTKAADMAKGPPLVLLSQLDSPFQLQEHLKALYADLTHGQNIDHSVPINRDTALSITRPPQISDGEAVDKNLWLYELCRFLTMKANYVSCALMADNPPCSSITCPEMRASEWQYLCAVHEPPKSCCAIDYVNHTLDWAANVLTSPKHFPSRLQLGGDPGNAFQSMRQLTNIFRRVYRIFAHAWFQHREVFWHIETTYGIYVLFKTVCDEYSLIPEDNYTVPLEAEGPREDYDTPINPTASGSAPTMQILRKENSQFPHQNGHDSSETTTVSTGATTRRHKHTPSTGSHVGTIAEGAEEEEDAPPLPTLPGSSPPKPKKISTERATPQDLGRLDIADTVSSYVPQQIEDPTPTTAQASTGDPLAAAGKTKKRNNSFESEIKSPGGGSFRTAGPDLLNAILGHMESVDEGDDDDGKSVETAVLIEEEDTQVTEKQEPAEPANPVEPAKPAKEIPKKGSDDEEENETMEVIELPDRTKVIGEEAGKLTGNEKPKETEAAPEGQLTEPEIAEEKTAVAAEEKTSADETKEEKPEDLSEEQKEAPAGVA